MQKGLIYKSEEQNCKITELDISTQTSWDVVSKTSRTQDDRLRELESAAQSDREVQGAIERIMTIVAEHGADLTVRNKND